MQIPMSDVSLISTTNARFNNRLDNTMIDPLNADGSLEPGFYRSLNQDYGHDFKPTFYDPFEVKHRRRTTRAQFKVLEKTFQENPKPSATIRRMLAQRLNMTPRGVQVWFQNRRAKAKLQSQQDKQRGSELGSSCEDCSSGKDAWTAPIKDCGSFVDHEFQHLPIYNNTHINPNYFSYGHSSHTKTFYSNGGPMISASQQKKFEPVHFMSNESFPGFQLHEHSHLRAAFTSLHDESPSNALLRRNSCPANMISSILPMHMLQQCPLPKLSGNNYLSSSEIPPKMRRWSTVNTGFMADQEQMSYMNSMPQSSEAYSASCAISPGFPSWEVDSASSVSSSPSCLQLSMSPGASSPGATAATTPLPLSFSGPIQANNTINLSQLQCAIDSFSVE